MPRAKKKKHAGGRPSTGLSEVRVDVPMPEKMRANVRRAAEREGVTVVEFARRALRVRLGETLSVAEMLAD